MGIDMDWQPIETAPKDGRRILAYSKEYGVQVTGWWYRNDNPAIGGWWIAFSDGDYTDLTHWQPLPEPPK